MGLSKTAYCYRDRQERLSSPVFIWGLTGSLVAHIGLLPIVIWMGDRPIAEPQDEPRIELVVTESQEPQPRVEVSADDSIVDEPVEPALPPPPPEPAFSAVEAAPVETTDPEPSAEIAVDEAASESVAEPVETAEVEIAEVVSDDRSANTDPVEASESSNNDVPPAQRTRTATGDRNTEQETQQAGSDSTEGDSSGESDTVAAANNGEGEMPAQRSSGSRTVACLSCPAPTYPNSARRSGAEGTVSLSINISEGGQVTSATLTGSSGHSALDQAALSTVRGAWRFQPVDGGAYGVPVSVVMTLEGTDFNREAQERGDRQSLDIEDESAEAATSPDSQTDSGTPLDSETSPSSSDGSSSPDNSDEDRANDSESQTTTDQEQQPASEDTNVPEATEQPQEAAPVEDVPPVVEDSPPVEATSPMPSAPPDPPMVPNPSPNILPDATEPSELINPE